MAGQLNEGTDFSASRGVASNFKTWRTELPEHYEVGQGNVSQARELLS